MRNIFLKRAMVTLLIASWCMQPVMAVQVNNWTDLSKAVADNESTVSVNGTLNAEQGAIQVSGANNTALSGGIIDGNSNHQLFFNYGNLTLNTTIQNAVAGGGNTAGSVLQNNGTLTIGSNAVIQNNTNNYWGGAIHQEMGATNVLSGARFLNNTTSGSAGYGGAINMQAGTLTIADGNASTFTLFEGNSAKSGGAIFNKLNEYQTPATGIYNPAYGSNTTTTVGNYTQFKNNTATGGDGGGAIQNQSVLVIKDHVLFEGNQANGGGAISNISSTVDLGGGISHSNADYLSLTIGDYVTFKSNTSNWAGALYSTGGSVSIGKNAQFDRNTSQGYGGAVTNAGGEMSIGAGSVFENNSANGGGAVFNAGTLTLGSSTISSNTATTAGGAIANTGTLNLDTTEGNITFSNNTANGAANDIAMTGASVDNKAVLNIKGASNTVSLNVITGDANSTINKTTENTLALNGDNSAYAGEFNQSFGTTTVASGAKFFGGTNNISGGDVNVSGTMGGTNKLTGGSVTLEDGSTLSGTADIKGGSMTLKGGNDNTGAVITFKNAMSRMFRNSRAVDSDTLVLDTTSKDLALDASVISEAGAAGTVNKTGSNTLNVNTDQNAFKGTFNNQDGTTTIDGSGKKFFGGTNNINKGTLNVRNGAELVANSTTKLNNTSSMNLDNNAIVAGNVEMSGASAISINSDTSTGSSSTVNITGAITGGGSITLNDGNLVIGAGNDLSGYNGNFTQEKGKTTVNSGAKFFGGTNTVKLGEFVFASDAILTSEVTVEDDAVLTITGAQDKTFNGNTMLVGGNTVGFVINKADFSGSGSSIDTKADNFSGDITFTDGAALGSSADVTLTTVGGKSGQITMGEGSVSTAGSKVKLTDSTSFDITAEDFVLNTNISSDSGVGTVNVAQTVNTLSINSDNSAFTGVYNQEAGAVTVNSGAKFFKGTNNIKAGSVTFANGSYLYGNNILTNTASMVINDGTNIDTASVIDLNSADSLLSFAGSSLTIGNEIKGSGKISNSVDLTVAGTAKTDSFTGTYTQNAGAKTTVESGASLFNGTNTINGGSVEIKKGGAVAGQNTLNNGSSYLVHDGASLANGTTINLNNSSASLNFGDNTDTDNTVSTALNIALQGVSGSTVNKNGAGILNITADQSGFGGKFVQSKGTTTISNKFFNQAEINSGVLNLITGSDISASTIALGADADMYILADTTINNAITGTGDIFVGADSQGISTYNPTVALNADESAFLSNYTQKNGVVNVLKGFFGGTNKIEGGQVNLNTSTSVLKGKNTIGGGTNNAKVTLSNGASIDDSASTTVTLANKGTLELADTADRNLTKVINGTSGTLAKTGTGTLKVAVDQNQFTGEFRQTNGTTTVDNHKFFGGTNNIDKGTLNVQNNAQLVSGSTTKLNNDSVMNVSGGSAVAGNVEMSGTSSININKNSESTVTISGDISSSNSAANAADIQITLEQGELVITGNQSGYNGTFTQNNGKTTVKSGATFFGGVNNIENGIFNFEGGANLASDININNQNIELIIGGAGKTLSGDKLIVDASGYGFVLNDALITGSDSLITTTGNNFTGHMTFKDGAGVGTGAQLELSKGASTSGHLTFSTGSAAQGGTVTMTDGNAKVDIVASNSNFNTAIAGTAGTVTVKKENLSSAAPVVTIASDNSGFKGNYKQQDGSDVTVSGKFFNGTNTIDNSKLTFNSGSTLNGNNTFSNAAELVINGNTNTSADSTIVLNGTSSMKLQGTDLTLNSDVSGNSTNTNALVNALTGTFTVKGDNSLFGGNYTQASSTTVVDGGKFFGGTNTINGGSIEFKNNAAVAGANTLNNTASMTINNGSSYVSGASVALASSGAALTLNNTDTVNSMTTDGLTITGTQGVVNKTGAGALDVNSDQTFSGTYNQNGGTVNVGGKFFGGTNNINAGSLNMKSGSTLAGSNIFASSAELVINDGVSAGTSTITLNDGSILTLNPAQNKTVTLSDYDISASGTNTIINMNGLGALIVDASNTITGASNSFTGKFNQTSGTTNVTTNFFGGTNTISGGTLNFNQDGVVLGNNTITGSEVNLNDGSSIGAGASIALGQNGILNFTGTGTVAAGNAQNLNVAINGASSQYGAVNKTGAGELVINSDQSAFKGDYTQKAGTTTVENGKLFGGSNVIESGKVEMKDNSSLASNATVTMGAGTTMNISNSGRDALSSADLPSATADKTVLSGEITSTDNTSNINVFGEYTYLVIDGDMSGYTGKFTQSSGAVTEVLKDATFFGGENDIQDGTFIFRQGAKLVQDVYISGDDVTLTLGNGDPYQIEDGNKVYYYIDGTKSTNAFILENVKIQGSLFDGSGDLTASKLTFTQNGGFASGADYILKTPDGAAKTSTINMGDGSVAQDGAKLEITNGAVLNITAAYMEKDEASTSKDGTFGMDISGDGNVNVFQNGADAPKFTIISDNSAFTGQYLQTAGEITVKGNSDTDKAYFFNGNNIIQGGSVIFEANSEILGKNQIDASGTIQIKDGAIIADGSSIGLNGGSLAISNNTQDFDLNKTIGASENGGTIKKDGTGKLILSENQASYKGEFVQTSGNTVINAAKSFFGGKNTISAGSVDATAIDTDNNGAILAGANTVNGTGKIIIGDFTNTSNLTDNKITLDSADAVVELNSTDGNDRNLSIAFAVESGTNGNGSVLHTGNGALNLYNAGDSNLFENFKGTFEQTATGVTNVFGKSFANNDIKNGILNLKNGAELVAGTTNLGADGVLNIGTLENDITVDPVDFNDDSKVTLSASLTGDGKVNVSQGQTTITASSQNDGFAGNYTQTGGTVTAEKDSTFFGGTNLISKGKLIFKKEANLAAGKNVELKGNSDVSTGEITSAVLDLDNRTDAVFNGANLYIDGKDTEGFTFSEGVLVNAMLDNTQNIGDSAFVTLKGGSGIADTAQMNIADAKVFFGTGSVSQEGAVVELTDSNSVLGLVSTNLDWRATVTGTTGTVSVEKDTRETSAPNINLYGDQSGFTGAYLQDAGTVNVKNETVFFKGDGSNLIVQGGDLILDKGSLLSGDLNINGAGGATDKHGRVWIADKIYDVDGNELNDISKLMTGDLYYNTKADGSDIDKNHITITNGGLVLSNGTIFDGSQGVTVFDKTTNGVVDIGFSNGTGVNGDIELREDTMLSYGDNAFIKDDSTLIMDGNAILNFINKNTELTYNPTITGGGAIYKEGLATTNVSSAIDMKGEVKVKEGTLNFTNKDKVSFQKTEPAAGAYGRQTGNLEVGGADSNAVINIVAKETNFGGNVIANAQDGTQSGLNLLGQNTTIGGDLSANNTNVRITGNTTIGGNFSIDGNSALNLIGGSANRIVVDGSMTIGDNLKDGKLPIAFDYDPHRGGMDSIIVNGQFKSDLPLLITGVNFVTSPADRVFNLDATTLIQADGPDTPTYDPTSFYANTAMGRYYLTNGAGGSALTGTLTYLNPQMYRGQVATIASWQNQLVVNNMLFDHMDVLTRQLMSEQKTANKYAAAYPQFAPYQYDLKGGSLWYKAYGNFETLSMTKGLNVKNNAYGSLIGADFPLIKLKNGWSLVPTAYIGYNGAHQTFDGVSMYQNGAQLGFMGTAYKGDFITSLLAYGGGYANDMSVKGGAFGSGSDTTGNWFAGVASKTAYNIKLPKDFIFQPTLLMSYNAFGNQNWGSNFGVLSMNSGMLNGVNVAPGFNLIWQKKTFNIYATAQMVYNIMGVVDGRAGNVDLGNVRMRHSYFEYGLGVSKSFKERFMGYLQFTIRNGGRTGIGFQGGLQWKIGK